MATLGEVCQKTGWKISAYVLMGNHYHLLLSAPESNLVAGMTWFQGNLHDGRVQADFGLPFRCVRSYPCKKACGASVNSNSNSASFWFGTNLAMPPRNGKVASM